MEFTSYPEERLYIDSLCSRLTGTERLVRKEIMNQIIDCGGPVADSDLEHLDDEHGIDTTSIISSLLDKKVIVKLENGDIAFVFPVSAMPTSHKVRLDDGRMFHAMCAVDALGSTFTFGQNVSIFSACAHCKEPVTVKVRNGQIAENQPAEVFVLHADLKKMDNWASSC